MNAKRSIFPYKTIVFAKYRRLRSLKLSLRLRNGRTKMEKGMKLLEMNYNHRCLISKNKSHVRNVAYRACSRYREHRSIEGFRSSGGALMYILKIININK